ncbi:hypothetical protein AB0I39_33345 [Kitasatospora purpeofusca]|uniref:hypothetical protein n=1 Tax=Kitasatospora purpeofusca TaxID=67352 RepID=UPI0033E54A00
MQQKTPRIPSHDKRRIVTEAAEWFMTEFPGSTSIEAAYDSADWAAMAMPYIATPEHFFLACRMSIMMIWVDDAAVGSNETRQAANVLLGHELPRDSTSFTKKLASLMCEFSEISMVPENNAIYQQYLAGYFLPDAMAGSPTPGNYGHRVFDVCMVPFYTITSDSHGRAMRITEKFIEFGVYSTAIDNQALSYAKEMDESDAQSVNELRLEPDDRKIFAAVSGMYDHYRQHCDSTGFDFFDIIAHQGRLGSILWTLQSPRYGRILHNALSAASRDGLVENLRRHVESRPGYYGYRTDRLQASGPHRRDEPPPDRRMSCD